MNRTSNPTLKPEYVLKRVNDLINSAVGSNEKEKRLALEQLHNVIGVKRKGVWNKFYETLMKKHLELCVDLKDHHTAKDGLHQYRNLCQAVDPASLEIIVLHLMELSEARATQARTKADKVAILAAARVSDLDQEETPESIMLSSMTEEGAKDRTDREVVVPWLKFLWENYRAILELLYKIPKLEKVYHKACEKAFKFCLEYNRVLEFKRLCDMLRSQLANLQKSPSASSRNRLQWEWTPEAVELHLQTRFHQLEGATQLELWNEGYRTVEDIYGIMVAGKKTPKAKLMMTYYDKLQRIFWVSDNKLFHAYAWYRYYCLCCDSRKDLKDDEKASLASSVLLSALTVPSMMVNYSFGDDEEEVVEKSSPMALLLEFQSNPSRQSLLNEISARGVLADVLPELSTLYENLEVKFQPLALVKKISAAVAAVQAQPSLSMYAAPLQKVAVTKLMQQLGRVYSTIKLDFLYKLLSRMPDLTPNVIERILVDGVAHKQLQLRVNHATKSIRFGSSPGSNNSSSSGGGGGTVGSNASSPLDSQVSNLGTQLNRVSHSISLALGQKTLEAQKAAARKAYLQKVSQALGDEYAESLDRKAQIERRKEELELQQQKRIEAERVAREKEEAERQDEEKRRLDAEEQERIDDKNRKKMEKMEVLRAQKELERYGVMMEEAAIAELDHAARRQLISDAQNEALKAKEEEARKSTEQARRLDHITRALRIESAGAIAKRYEQQVAEDKALYDDKLVEFYNKAKARHAEDLVVKQQLSRMQSLREGFEADIVKAQRATFDKQLARVKAKAMKDRTEQVIAKARRLQNEALEAAEAEEERERERLAKEEQARLELEQYERLRIKREEDKEREERMLRQIRENEEKQAADKAKREEEEAAAQQQVQQKDSDARSGLSQQGMAAQGGAAAAGGAGAGGGGGLLVLLLLEAGLLLLLVEVELGLLPVVGIASASARIACCRIRSHTSLVTTLSFSDFRSSSVTSFPKYRPFFDFKQERSSSAQVSLFGSV
mmetsp:Transcript_14993/g.24995  ORF Transcript_14993/g.24995 Transcript_14993/m.24995 type:complete len:1011 (-) Transcript_14993:2-3034(-)